MVTGGDILEMVGENQVQKHVAELAFVRIFDLVEELLKEPRVLQIPPCLFRELMLPRNSEADQKGQFVGASGVETLAATANAAGEGTPDQVVFLEGIPAPRQHLTDQFAFAASGDVGGEQEVHRKHFSCQANDGLGLAVDLILELLPESAVGRVGGIDKLLAKAI